jgi:protocatechuate 3,4-dioxygenase beta subunit/peroxiredoxin
MRIAVRMAVLLHLLLGPASAAEPRSITGRIVDDKGRPIAEAAIDFFWSANGRLLDAEGKPRDPSSEEAQKQYWSQFGRMEPVLTTTSHADGRFSLQARGTFYTIMAMDADRTRGGLMMIPKDYNGSDIEIRLQPMVRVQATIYSAVPGDRPAHIMTVTEVPADPARPLAMCRLVLAETRDSRLLMSLPPGSYVLDAYDDQLKTSLQHKFTLKDDKPEVDLGILKLLPAKPNINETIQQSQADGAMGDYTKNYGKQLPAWHIVDARGVDKNVQLSDFKGKWLIVHFWALSCASCLKDDLPRLTKFYEDHQAQHDKFEVVAICVDHNGELKSIADVDRALKPIVENVWNGKQLPFPILLDPSMTTLERFGVPGYQTLLVDPEGRLVKGDETTLAKQLAEKTH